MLHTEEIAPSDPLISPLPLDALSFETRAPKKLAADLAGSEAQALRFCDARLDALGPLPRIFLQVAALKSVVRLKNRTHATNPIIFT